MPTRIIDDAPDAPELTDEEFEAAEVTRGPFVSRDAKVHLSARFDRSDVKRIREAAEARGIGVTEFMREATLAAVAAGEGAAELPPNVQRMLDALAGELRTLTAAARRATKEPTARAKKVTARKAAPARKKPAARR